MRRCLSRSLLIATSLLLSNCGGGGTVAEGGIGGTGISMGRVTQLGSIYVNGIHYNTDNATFSVDGDTTRTHDDITVGMVVRITGTRDTASATGVAESVAYESLLIGPVDAAFDATDSHIGVMGQAVHVNADTVYENAIPGNTHTLDTLPLDAMVEVSGFPDTLSGEILATRIELLSAVSHYKVSGVAGAVDPGSAAQFPIGGLIIDAGALLNSIPAPGTYVAVQSSLPPDSANLPSTPTLFTAESITLIDTSYGGLSADGEQVDIEGVITLGLDMNDLFMVNGLTVDASLTPLTGNAIQLAAGRIVEVDGVMNGAVLLAENIELEASNRDREEISALLESGAVNLAASTVTLMGQTIHVTNSTILEDDHEGSSTFSLADLSTGDYLEAKIYDSNGELTASKLELEEDSHHSDNAVLEGNPGLIDSNNIEILGVTIDISRITGYTFDANQRIEVKGDYDPISHIVTASSISNAD